ncbi:hypothetical protein L9F63_025558, partial [Diploptera punctata]
GSNHDQVTTNNTAWFQFYSSVATIFIKDKKYINIVSDNCEANKLTVYKVILQTFWTRDQFPKHYPDWRPPAQWSRII